MADKIFNPSSGNDVSIKWAVSQGIIDESGEYLDDDGAPAALIELVSPDADLDDDLLKQHADKAKEVAADVFGDDNDQFSSEEQASIDALREKAENVSTLRERVDTLEEEKSALEQDVQAAESEADRYRSRKEALEVQVARQKQAIRKLKDTNAELRSTVASLESDNSDLQDQIEPPEPRTRHDQDGGISIS